jgi:uncharacterized protein YggT (Ycf19 family)
MPFLVRLIDLYSLVVLVAVILSWVQLDRRNPLVTITRGLTEPVLAPIRKVLLRWEGWISRRWFC